jgi:teichuronic acid biosynthesis glycosyltransferase TuaG
MTPSVTVIIPTWNRAHTIRAAIASVLDQTYRVHEVLVCDDGSTDNTFEVVNSFNDERVKFLSGPRAGRPAVPRNRGIALATGEWIAFLDSDDQWLPDKLDNQFRLLELDATEACCTNAWRVLPGKGRVSEYLPIGDKSFHLTDLLHVNSVICSSALIKRETIELAGGFPEAENLKAIEDYALWLRVSTLTDFSFCGSPLVEYMDDATNSVRSDAKENVQRENVMRDFYTWYCRQNETQGYRSVIRTALRKAMKNNGRSIIERWKIK